MAQEIDRLRSQIAELQNIKGQILEVLVVNWIPLKDNDYRQALAQLVENAIQEHDDPALSNVAQERQSAADKLSWIRSNHTREKCSSRGTTVFKITIECPLITETIDEALDLVLEEHK